MEFYEKRREAFLHDLKKLTTRYNIISASRLLIAVAFLILGYYSLKAEKPLFLLCGMAFCVVEFILLMNRHVLVRNKKLRAEALVKINKDETDYLNGISIPFNDGEEFEDHFHPYSYDLDIFGRKSLFHNLNRTKTFRGNHKLAGLLKGLLPNDVILQNQKAIKELSGKPEFRQEVMALGMVNQDNKAVYNRLITWANSGIGKLPPISAGLLYLGPIAFVSSFLAYILTGNGLFGDIAGWCFGFNLLLTLLHLKDVKSEIKHITEIDEIIHHYGLIIKEVENESFESEKLKTLQSVFVRENKNASKEIKKLAVLFSRLDSINNVFGALLFNGVIVFHLHSLKALWKWKQQHAADIVLWLETIAEIEALGSFGNMYYNNPDFVFPELNTEYTIEFKKLAHPLIRKEQRIGNSISFDKDFMILTGSNMSGKSTFLRSLGVNMVLAGAGAPVCAEKATIHPLPVLVSMRLSDSLSDNESYFFAEVKRLKYIIDLLANKRAFVLLDEILKGTNSDDKRSGTVKVIEKMLELKAVGAIATHDIEICALTDEYPSKLVNRCFEAQIVNNELYFDYQLRDGVCRNKSATFLMEKMGVI
ncbi:MAG: DNA mismatch repair protein [Flavobacterium psychrophilum]|nr:MAG: DNA mismatch repair protein [Flavobacterium psychrophilum]